MNEFLSEYYLFNVLNELYVGETDFINRLMKKCLKQEHHT